MSEAAGVLNQGVKSDWHGLYREKWAGLIHPDAIAHPAKFARALIRQIYQHAIDEGWLETGNHVIDPFGGVGLGAHDAMRHGLVWTGVELEMRFVGLGNENLRLWNEHFAGRLPVWGSARLLQGDSRRLASVIDEACAVISSPPYAGDSGKRDRTGHERAERRAAEKGFKQGLGCFKTSEAYGRDDAQLGAMPDGDFNAVISSPPFVESLASDDPVKRGGLFKDEKRKNDKTLTATYGTSAGQLGAMKEGAAGLVSSPPFSPHGNQPNKVNGGSQGVRASYPDGQRPDAGYSMNPDNLGNSTGDTFWAASRLILSQCHQILTPGAHAIFVVKDFVRNKRVVPFCEQWAQLCEAVGFRLIHIHRSWLIEQKGVQHRLDGGEDNLSIERKSFFRLLAERKGSPRIDYETVLCFERL
jgi:hypothetical protein